MSSRYTEFEKSLLHSLYTKYNIEVNQRTRDASRNAWENLTAEFNRSSGIINRRDVNQLKSKIQHIKHTQELPAASNRRSIRLLSRVSSTASRRSGDGSDPRDLRQMPDRRAQRLNSQSPPSENDEQRKRMELLELQIQSEQWKIQVLQNKDRVQMKKIEKLTKEIHEQ